jgi:hypothetical protein
MDHGLVEMDHGVRPARPSLGVEAFEQCYGCAPVPPLGSLDDHRDQPGFPSPLRLLQIGHGEQSYSILLRDP